MSVFVLVFTDGRPGLLRRTLVSAFEQLRGDIIGGAVVNDCLDPRFLPEIQAACRDFAIIPPGAVKRGFCGAVRDGWLCAAASRARFVFHLEDDFTFNRPVPLDAMAATLDERPYLVQLALRRQAWNDAERAAGGVVEVAPQDFTEVQGAHGPFLEHRRFFTTNPSLYRRELLSAGWPGPPNCEGVFTHQLLTDPRLRFGYWGARSDPPWVHHIGDERAGTGY